MTVHQYNKTKTPVSPITIAGVSIWTAILTIGVVFAVFATSGF